MSWETTETEKVKCRMFFCKQKMAKLFPLPPGFRARPKIMQPYSYLIIFFLSSSLCGESYRHENSSWTKKNFHDDINKHDKQSPKNPERKDVCKKAINVHFDPTRNYLSFFLLERESLAITVGLISTERREWARLTRPGKKYESYLFVSWQK